eukprot:gene7130-236_t
MLVIPVHVNDTTPPANAAILLSCGGEGRLLSWTLPTPDDFKAAAAGVKKGGSQGGLKSGRGAPNGGPGGGGSNSDR